MYTILDTFRNLSANTLRGTSQAKTLDEKGGFLLKLPLLGLFFI